MRAGQEPIPLADHLNPLALAEALQSSLRNTLFSSGLTVSPRQVNKLATDIASGFAVFYEDRDDAVAQTAGRQLAEAGLGPRSILAMTDALNRECRQHANPLVELPDIAGAYVNALLEGFMAGREDLVRREQERTLQAYMRASAQRAQDTP